ncbi:MAG: hypothetical protein ABEH40_06495 [Haloferacaceae archaeon]
MANRTRSDETADGETGVTGDESAGEADATEDGSGGDGDRSATSGYRLPGERVDDLHGLADRIDDLAETLPLGAARHHARKAAEAARTAADNDARLIARRAAVGELVTELRTAADEADSTRVQYQLLEILYERALPATRAASAVIYD